ncbi:hypothetical protein AVEN_63842-1 [Araneus ventricosus]|uniref:Uncharacterized protein n=1 Tax=Araneus ventricosus TaxID=182803 RepID=A0A4Y2FXL0_ARAVE|nr:hypothetical protein AVEN_63842-1 [Araneus ventricosus]
MHLLAEQFANRSQRVRGNYLHGEYTSIHRKSDSTIRRYYSSQSVIEEIGNQITDHVTDLTHDKFRSASIEHVFPFPQLMETEKHDDRWGWTCNNGVTVFINCEQMWIEGRDEQPVAIRFVELLTSWITMNILILSRQ